MGGMSGYLISCSRKTPITSVYVFNALIFTILGDLLVNVGNTELCVIDLRFFDAVKNCLGRDGGYFTPVRNIAFEYLKEMSFIRFSGTLSRHQAQAGQYTSHPYVGVKCKRCKRG